MILAKICAYLELRCSYSDSYSPVKYNKNTYEMIMKWNQIMLKNVLSAFARQLACKKYLFKQPHTSIR